MAGVQPRPTTRRSPKRWRVTWQAWYSALPSWRTVSSGPPSWCPARRSEPGPGIRPSLPQSANFSRRTPPLALVDQTTGTLPNAWRKRSWISLTARAARSAEAARRRPRPSLPPSTSLHAHHAAGQTRPGSRLRDSSIRSPGEATGGPRPAACPTPPGHAGPGPGRPHGVRAVSETTCRSLRLHGAGMAWTSASSSLTSIPAR